MDKYALAELIRRYRSGTATEQEKYLLEKIWNDALEDTSALDSLSEKDREALKTKMFTETRLQIEQLTETAKTRTLRPWVYRAAAACALFLAASVLLYWNAQRMTEIRAGFGEQLSVILPDKSQIILNGNSVLRYNKEWNDESTREVWIDGEGFFSVQHTQNDQKFIVHADQLNVEVLGTKFNIKSREQKSEVMLTEGKVKLNMQNSETASVFLKPGELATLADQKLSKQVVKQKKYTSWLHYTMIFDRTPLREVAILLKDTYGLDVTFTDDSLEGRELSGEISSANANDILYAIAETFNLKVERQGQEVTISSK